MRRLEKEIPYPKTIYKYSRINEFVFQQLTNNEFWFSNPQDFNDPYDCNIGFSKKEYSEGEIQAFWEGANASEEIKNQSIKDWITDQSLIEKSLFVPIRNLLREKGLACFTSKNDSILMWSHYADSHKGI